MRRVASLYLPSWSTDRLRRISALSPELPLITARQDGNRRVIANIDSAAHKLGLRPGMTIAHAQILVADLHISEAAPAADAVALRQLAGHCVRRFSPFVACDLPNGLWLDISGCAHLYGGEDALLDALLAECAEAGYRAKAAIADTTGAAYALARYSHCRISPPGTQQDALAGLPVAALRLPVEMGLALRQLGLTTIGQLYGIPRAPLARRFGALLMRRFDQALGQEFEAISPITLPELPSTERRFAEPVFNPDYLAKVIEGLSADLCRQVDVCAHGIRRADLIAHRVDNRIVGIRVGTARPSHDARHLTKLLIEKLPMIDAGFGIEKLMLTAPLIEPFDRQQCTTSYASQPEANLAGLIDVISNRIGARHIYRLQSVENDVPERAVIAIPPLATNAQTNWPSNEPRPGILLRRPEEVEAMALLPDHAPVQFIWRRDRYRIVHADGPERIFGEWWRRDEEIHAVRDYFRVEDDQGRRFWLFRRGDGVDPATGSHAWFLHGFFG